MFKLRSRVVLAASSEDLIVLQSSPGRRVLYGAIGLLLLIAMAMSVDWQADFNREMIVGTIIYLALTLTSIGVAAFGRSVRFDRSTGEISFIRAIAGVRVGESSMPLSDVRSVTIQGVQFLKESEQPQPGLLNTRFRNYVQRRNNYYKLYLDTDNSRRFLEDSTELADLDAAASRIAEFLGVELKRETV